MGYRFEKNIKSQSEIQQGCANAIISALCRGVAQANEALREFGVAFEYPEEITVTNDFRYEDSAPGSITYTVRRADTTSKE